MKLIKVKSNRLGRKLIKTLSVVWLLSIGVFIVTVVTNILTLNKVIRISFDSQLYSQIIINTVIVGVIAFVLLVFFTLFQIFLQKKVIVVKNSSSLSTVSALIRYFFILAILPIFFIIRILNLKRFINSIKTGNFRIPPLRSAGQVLAKIIFISITLLPFWALVYFLGGYLFLNNIGYIQEPIAVAGTGSMYPTFPKGEKKNLKRWLRRL